MDFIFRCSSQLKIRPCSGVFRHSYKLHNRKNYSVSPVVTTETKSNNRRRRIRLTAVSGGKFIRNVNAQSENDVTAPVLVDYFTTSDSRRSMLDRISKHRQAARNKPKEDTMWTKLKGTLSAWVGMKSEAYMFNDVIDKKKCIEMEKKLLDEYENHAFFSNNNIRQTLANTLYVKKLLKAENVSDEINVVIGDLNEIFNQIRSEIDERDSMYQKMKSNETLQIKLDKQINRRKRLLKKVSGLLNQVEIIQNQHLQVTVGDNTI